MAIDRAGWRGCLIGALVVTIVVIPMAALWIAESPSYLIVRRPTGALEKLNDIRGAIGLPVIAALPVRLERATAPGSLLSRLFAADVVRSTLLLWLAVFLTFGTLYFVLSWIPKLAVAAGLPQQQAIIAGTVYNVGAMVGTLSLPLAARRFGLRQAITLYLLPGALFLFMFGAVELPLLPRLAVATLMGFFAQGGFSGFYTLAARVYPDDIRSTGLGWAIGVGRLGSIVGPLAAGMLLEWKVVGGALFGIFAAALVIAAVVTPGIRDRRAEPLP
jgi:MFS family permease